MLTLKDAFEKAKISLEAAGEFAASFESERTPDADEEGTTIDRADPIVVVPEPEGVQ